MSSLATYTRPRLTSRAGTGKQRPPGRPLPPDGPGAHVDGIEVPVPAPDQGCALMDQRRIPDGGAGLDRPRQLAVVDIHGTDPAAAVAEHDLAAADGARVQDRPIRTVDPLVLARVAVQRVECPAHGADEHAALGDDRLDAGHQALIREKPVPLAFEGRPNLRRRRPRAGGIVRQHRPVATGRDCSVDQRRDASQHNDNGKRRESRTCTHRSHLTDWLNRTTEYNTRIASSLSCLLWVAVAKRSLRTLAMAACVCVVAHFASLELYGRIARRWSSMTFRGAMPFRRWTYPEDFKAAGDYSVVDGGQSPAGLRPQMISSMTHATM